MAQEIHTPASHPGHHTIGQVFKAWDGHRYVCDSWEANAGYWMFRTDDNGELARRNGYERKLHQ